MHPQRNDNLRTLNGNQFCKNPNGFQAMKLEPAYANSIVFF
jgi:hypothetical protein